MEITGYKIKAKNQGNSRTLIYRTTGLSDSRPVILKIARAGESREIVRFKQEFHIARQPLSVHSARVI